MKQTLLTFVALLTCNVLFGQLALDKAFKNEYFEEDGTFSSHWCNIGF
jgi:hypothetical protein